MWNHKLKYKGVGGTRYNTQIAPTANGSFSVTVIREELLGLYYKRGVTLEEINNILLYCVQEIESPARLAGNILLVHETLNQKALPRQAWIYNPGQRRVRRAPNVAYDNPGTASDGLRTNDMTDTHCLSMIGSAFNGGVKATQIRNKNNFWKFYIYKLNTIFIANIILKQIYAVANDQLINYNIFVLQNHSNDYMV